MAERLMRPREVSFGGAQIFAREVLKMLDKLGVRPGQAFFVAATGHEAKARSTDPETSKAAAKSVEEITDKQRDVLKIFEDWRVGLTDVKLVQIYTRGATAGIVSKQAPSGIRTRRRELVDAGLLVDTEEREKLPSGRKAIMWGLAPDVLDSLFADPAVASSDR